MIDFDVMVSWRRADDTTIDLPATVCYRDGNDSIERRAEVASAAITSTAIDFPDDLGDDAVPIRVVFGD